MPVTGVNQIQGVSVKKPKGAYLYFPKLDMKKFNLRDDERLSAGFTQRKENFVSARHRL